MDLKGKKIIVTGGVRGLGRAIVDRLLAEEAVPAVLDKDRDACASLKKGLPDICVVPCDLSDPQQVTLAIADCCQRLGGLDGLVNNAGYIFSAPLIKMTAGGIETHSVDAWNSVLAANLHSVFHTTSAVAAYMARNRIRGVIVNVSSISAAGNAGQSAYAAAKAGVNALTVTWARELAAFRIRVAGLSPGFSDTASTRNALSQPVLDETLSRVPLKRLGKPEEIADGVVWILKNDYFCGKTLSLDGGLAL